MEWKPIETAPKGHYEDVPHGKGTVRVHVPEKVFLALKEGDWVGVSWWLPDEERWCFTSKDKNTPIAWHPLLKHPNTAE